MVELTFREGVTLRDSLRAAFRSRMALEQVISGKLGADPKQVAGHDNYGEALIGLIRWAEENQRTVDLIQGARALNPGDALLGRFEADYQAHRAGEAGMPGPPPSALTPALRLALVDAVLQLPVASDYVGRSSFLQGVPPAVTRSNDPRTDLNTMFDQLDRLGQMASGKWPLLVVIDNILPFTTGWQAHDVVQRIRQTLAQAYGA